MTSRVSHHNLQSGQPKIYARKGVKEHTQSLSFLALGTPISSNVLGPLPGSPWPLGFDGCVGGLGVDGAVEALDG